jgi:hypothetical protein
MGQLSKMTEKATKEWANSLTLEHIEESERQGCDMSEYRIIYEEKQAERRKAIEENMAAIDMGKLDKYKKTPRVDSDFVNAVAGFFGGKSKDIQQLENAPLVYGKVVQANSALFTPNEDSIGSTGIVFVFALDEAHRCDEAWLTKTAKRISEMREQVDKNEPKDILYMIYGLLDSDNKGFFAKMKESKKLEIIPQDCRPLIKALRDVHSSFCFPLSESLNEGADAWCVTFWLDKPSKLPFTFIPYSRIIPFIVTGTPVQKCVTSIIGSLLSKDGANLRLIPPTYYLK